MHVFWVVLRSNKKTSSFLVTSHSLAVSFTIPIGIDITENVVHVKHLHTVQQENGFVGYRVQNSLIHTKESQHISNNSNSSNYFNIEIVRESSRRALIQWRGSTDDISQSIITLRDLDVLLEILFLVPEEYASQQSFAIPLDLQPGHEYSVLVQRTTAAVYEEGTKTNLIGYESVDEKSVQFRAGK